MDDHTPSSDGDLDSFQDVLEDYNRNFDRVTGLLGENGSLTEASALKQMRVEDTKNVLAESLPIAVKSMIFLASRAESESVRYNASKFLIAVSLGKDPAIKADDPTLDLISRLQGEDAEEEAG